MNFIDLNRQYDVIGEKIEKGIKEVIDSKHFIMGPEIGVLEEMLAEYTGRKYAFSCSSGTDALVIPLMAYELTKTDAVFVPAFTFFASAESVVVAGGTPVFVDCDASYNIDTEDLERKIKEVLQEGKLKPRGIIPVDLFGVAADYDRIEEIAQKYGLFVLEDAAQGFGASYNNKKTGCFGDVSATSFFPAKPLGGYGDGGAIFTDDDHLAELIRSIRVHGMGTDRYDNVRIGLNGRLDTLQAAILIPKLEILDDEVIKRNKVADRYIKNLKDHVITPVIPENKVSSWAQFSVLVKDKETRSRVIAELKEKDIPVMVYYPIPMHLQTAFGFLGHQKGELPVCEGYAERILSLPMHPYLREDEIDMISEALIAAVR